MWYGVVRESKKNTCSAIFSIMHKSEETNALKCFGLGFGFIVLCALWHTVYTTLSLSFCYAMVFLSLFEMFSFVYLVQLKQLKHFFFTFPCAHTKRNWFYKIIEKFYFGLENVYFGERKKNTNITLSVYYLTNLKKNFHVFIASSIIDTRVYIYM